jgi:lysozyme
MARNYGGKYDSIYCRTWCDSSVYRAANLHDLSQTLEGTPMNINQDGLDLLKSFEGCKLEAYPDPGTGDAPWTIGYGCTTDVKPGDTINQEMAEFMLLRDVAMFEKGVSDLIKVDVTPNQFSACVVLAYNIGMTNFGASTLLRMINAQDPNASAQFLRWNRAAGQVMAGLTRRREAEKQLYDLG